MTTRMHNAQTLIEKIQSPPTERIAEVEDFVDFLRQRTASKKNAGHEPLGFPVGDLGPWPEG